MKQMTLRDMDGETVRRIREISRKEGVSLNRAALRLLRAGSAASARGTDVGATPKKIGRALDRFIGTWSDKEADFMRRAEKEIERIDPEIWK